MKTDEVVATYPPDPFPLCKCTIYSEVIELG